jgi:hypothetical protein
VARDQIQQGIGSRFHPAMVEMSDRVEDAEIEPVRLQFPDAF